VGTFFVALLILVALLCAAFAGYAGYRVLRGNR
jgi:hypothetical protein